MNQEIHLTREGREKLEYELEELRTTRRREVAERIQKASESGGMLDNAEYEEAKNQQSFMEARISELELVMFNSVVDNVVGKRVRGGVVVFGSSVTVSVPGGRKRSYKLVGSVEANPVEGKISVESPVGRALIGSKVGDTVEVEVPSGVSCFKIVKVK